MTSKTTTAKPQDRWYKADRLGGLRRFAAAITIFNILGHTWFGFEQSWAQPFVGLAAAYESVPAAKQHAPMAQEPVIARGS